MSASACKGAKAEELLLLALQGNEQLEPLRQWLKLLLQKSPKLSSMQAVAADHGEGAALFLQLHDLRVVAGKTCCQHWVPDAEAHDMRSAAQGR